MNPKRILIVFSDVHLAYSPSTLSLFYGLKRRGHEVFIIAPDPDVMFSVAKIDNSNVRYLNIEVKRRNLFQRVYGKIVDNVISKKKLAKRLLVTPLVKSFTKEIEKSNAEIIIAVDFLSLWCVQEAGKNAHLLSLEIPENDPYFKSCDLGRILSVIIQTESRYNYLFKDANKPPFFILPNSPAYTDITPAYQDREKYNLIYCGSATIQFGIFSCLDFISDFPQYKLTIKGAIPEATREGIDKFYSHLIENGQLIFNTTYLDPVELTNYISGFWAGFVFYDFYRSTFLRRFNYYSAPSGKLFQYFNSGIPVVANSLEGFDIVKEYNAGRLIDNLSSLKIKTALDEIEAAYYEISKNSKKLSLVFDSTSYLNAVMDNILKTH